MKNFFDSLLVPMLLAITLFAGAGCKEKTAAEKTSDAVENAYDKTKTAVKNGAEAVKDGVKQGVEKTGEALDKAGQKIKEVAK